MNIDTTVPAEFSVTPTVPTLAILAGRLGISYPQVVALASWEPPGGRLREGFNIEAFRNYMLDHPERTSRANVGRRNDLDEDEEELGAKGEEQELKNEKLRKAIRQMDLDYEKEIGELVPRQQIREALAETMAPVAITLEKHLDRTTYNKVVSQLREAVERTEKKFEKTTRTVDATRNRAN